MRCTTVGVISKRTPQTPQTHPARTREGAHPGPQQHIIAIRAINRIRVPWRRGHRRGGASSVGPRHGPLPSPPHLVGDGQHRDDEVGHGRHEPRGYCHRQGARHGVLSATGEMSRLGLAACVWVTAVASARGVCAAHSPRLSACGLGHQPRAPQCPHTPLLPTRHTPGAWRSTNGCQRFI